MRINQHIKEVHKLPEDWEKVARHSEPQFSKGKDDVWNDMVAEIDGKTQDPKVIQLRWFKYAAAAAIVLLLSITAFLRFYTETVSVPAGLHKGEAFFDVKKGSSFSVISKNGITTVLGTSFNINSREESYIVFCKTGKVSVELEASKVVIMSNESAQLKANGELEKRTGVNGSEFIGWVDDQFIFNARPLRYVTKEIELQYNIDLNILEDDVADWKFTGAFNRSDDVNVTLEVISISMGIKFEQNSDGSYSLMKQNH